MNNSSIISNLHAFCIMAIKQPIWPFLDKMHSEIYCTVLPLVQVTTRLRPFPQQVPDHTASFSPLLWPFSSSFLATIISMALLHIPTLVTTTLPSLIAFLTLVAILVAPIPIDLLALVTRLILALFLALRCRHLPFLNECLVG